MRDSFGSDSEWSVVRICIVDTDHIENIWRASAPRISDLFPGAIETTKVVKQDRSACRVLVQNHEGCVRLVRTQPELARPRNRLVVWIPVEWDAAFEMPSRRDLDAETNDRVGRDCGGGADNGANC